MDQQQGNGAILEVTATSRPAKALYSFEARVPDELTLVAGDAVEVLSEDVGGGWWFGRCRGQTGVFPANYVQ